MLLNYTDTLDDVFTLAHEMGHSMHTLLSHRHQPFVYAGYTIFVAEVPSTLSEALFLDYMLHRATDQRERIVLLQHAIDNIVATFYTQVLFADYELQAHRLVEEGRPVTAEGLGEIYFDLLKTYHGDALDYDELTRLTWARIPHFFSTPYYVYQYATCFASSAQLIQQLTTGSDRDRAEAIDRYLTLLKSGGSDHPMTLLQKAGVDLSKPETVRAVVTQLDTLVTRRAGEREREVMLQWRGTPPRRRFAGLARASLALARYGRAGAAPFTRSLSLVADAQEAVRGADARVHHDRQSAGLGARGRVLVDDTRLQP